MRRERYGDASVGAGEAGRCMMQRIETQTYYLKLSTTRVERLSCMRRNQASLMHHTIVHRAINSAGCTTESPDLQSSQLDALDQLHCSLRLAPTVRGARWHRTCAHCCTSR